MAREIRNSDGEEKYALCFQDPSRIHSFGPDPEIYSLATGMDMIGLSKPPASTAADFYDEFTKPAELFPTPSWAQESKLGVDDSSLRFLFPSCQGQAPTTAQGLSLSLSSAASTIGLGPGMGVRFSRYLVPAQDLLKEFCHIGSGPTTHDPARRKQQNKNKHLHNGRDVPSFGVAADSRSMSSFELSELQNKKAKLILMIEEVDARYKHYCEQMKAVVASFEAAAGEGAAAGYSALAWSAMSRHFRCLRDGIAAQIRAANKAMGDKEGGGGRAAAAGGGTRGETPRLRILDQALRQQKAFSQMVTADSHPWRPQRGLPERSVSVLRAWLFEHFLHPYPSDVDKHILARQTGLSRSQVSNWFINARVRLWKPMVEEMYLEETKEHDTNTSTAINVAAASSSHAATAAEDRKPIPEQLINVSQAHSAAYTSKTLSHLGRAVQAESPPFGAIELDFASYNHRGSGGGSGGVSLTLGLQQEGGRGGGVSLAFSPSSQSSLLYSSRDRVEDCQAVPYHSLFDGGEAAQNLPYRNLTGAQLLHDLVG